MTMLDLIDRPGDNLPSMPSWRHCAPVVTLLLLVAAEAYAQAGTAIVVVRVTAVDGTATGAVVEITPETGPGTGWSAQIHPATPAVAFRASPGRYQVRASLAPYRPAGRTVDVNAGEVVTLDLALETGGRTDPSAGTESDRLASAYQTVFEPRQLDTLPSARTVASLLETAHPFLVVDRIDGGGIWTGERALVGGQGTSARQVTFRLDGQDVTDPGGAGVALFYPDLSALQSVVVESATLAADVAGPGPVVNMTLQHPGRTWSGTAQFALSPEALQSESTGIPPIARLVSLTDGGGFAGGPLAGGRAGLFASARFTSAERVEREQEPRLESSANAFTAHATRAGANTSARLLVAFSDITRPMSARARFADRLLAEGEQSLAIHAGWERMAKGRVWSLSGAFQRASLDQATSSAAAGGAMERMRDGAPLALAEAAGDTRQRWGLRGGLAPAVQHWLGRDHIISTGVTVGGASQAVAPTAQPMFAELVNGRPARVWDVAYRGAPRWSALSASIFASDRIVVSDALTFVAAARAELDNGSAKGASNTISWFNISPRIAARWRPRSAGTLAITSSYGWYRHRLLLNTFAVGDPAGPSGSMYRWDDRDGSGTPAMTELTRVAAAGAGTPGSAIDEGLRRPTTREFRIGVEHALGSWRWSITGLDRREDDLIGLLNTGVTEQDYTVRYVDDPGVDVAGRSGYTPLPIYDRRPESFGRDQYLLTNSTLPPSRYQGVEIAVAKEAGERWYFRFGGTAYRAESVGANRGYRADENDQGLLGEVFTTPNAQTYARGRSFFDRAYVMKVLSAYTGPGPFRAAVVARYQDGQPFARAVIVDGLNQGTEVIQAYPRGGQRFTFTGTVDARVELRWPLGARRFVSLALDAFNLANMDLEVEEDVVYGPAFRTVTAVQPPRVVRLGVRLGF
jgi:hypothetical protein